MLAPAVVPPCPTPGSSTFVARPLKSENTSLASSAMRSGSSRIRAPPSLEDRVLAVGANLAEGFLAVGANLAEGFLAAFVALVGGLMIGAPDSCATVPLGWFASVMASLAGALMRAGGGRGSHRPRGRGLRLGRRPGADVGLLNSTCGEPSARLGEFLHGWNDYVERFACGTGPTDAGIRNAGLHLRSFQDRWSGLLQWMRPCEVGAP